MVADVPDDYLERINADLVRRGLTFDELREDILDHICCMVEEDMESGKEFESSYKEIMSAIDDSVLKDLQHKTQLLLDKKFQKMKKITYFFGLAGAILAITGAFFKTQHWPGAGILMTVGFMAVVLLFLPLYFIKSYKEQSEKPHVIYPVVAYLTLLFVFAGAVFKIMHWHGAGWIIRISIILLLVGFLPLYIVQIFKRSFKSKINPAYIIMLLVGISIVLILARVNLSKSSIDRYTELAEQYDASSGLLEERVKDFIKRTPDSLMSSEIGKVISFSDALELQLNQMQSGLLASVDQAGLPIAEVDRRDYRNGAKEAYIESGLANDFLKSCKEYKEYLGGIIADPVVVSQVDIELQFTAGDWISGWEPSDYRNEPLIVNYYMLSTMKQSVLFVEYLALTSLLSGCP